MKNSFLIGAFLLCGACWARAEVVDSAASGFTVRGTVTIGAAPEEVYRKLVRNVANWWASDHTFSGDARNLSIEERPGGCFCEKLPNGGGVRHMEVVNLAPGKMVVLSGGLGPLQSVAATGSMQFQFAAAEGGTTKLVFTYTVVGYQPAGMSSWAAPVDSVLGQQMVRLKSFVEHGDPAFRVEPAK